MKKDCLSRAEMKTGLSWWIGVFALLAIGASFFLTPEFLTRFPSVCPLRSILGLPCPGCGLTRSFVATAHGQFEDAFAFHALGPILFLGLFAFGLVFLLRRIPVFGGWHAASVHAAGRSWKLLLGLAIVFCLLRWS